MAPVIVSHTVIYLHSISGFQLISETDLTDVKYHGFLFIMHFKTAEVQVGDMAKSCYTLLEYNNSDI